MKSTQSILLLCVVVGMVFGVTFAVNYLGGRGTGKNGKKVAPQAELTFADNVTNFPSDGPPAECELGHSQSHDFWFKNDNAQDLPIGVFSKTCQCTSVQLWFARDLKDMPEAADREKAVNELAAVGPPMELKEKEAATTVPAGAVGVVRLAWTGDRAGSKDLAAELWQGEKGAGPVRRFVIRTVFLGPLRLESAEVDLRALPLDQLPYDRSFRCWSTTRRQFPLYARVLQHRLKEESNPFVVHEPVPLTEAELAELRKNPAAGNVMAGYRLTVTLRKEAEDKTPVDVGIFRQRIEVETKGGEPLQVVVKGTVLGDLAVVVPDSGPVPLGSFDCTQEVKQDVVVESGADVTRLEVDEQRTAEYLAVEFQGEPEKNGDRKTWKLQVKWLPEKQVVGVFPRDRDEYRDSAVYIKPVYARTGGTAPSLRIPVTGKADDSGKPDAPP